MLVLAVGVREAARKMGLNEKTVLHWSHTGDWLAHTRVSTVKPELPLSMRPRSVASVSPADALENTLLERKGEIRLTQSAYLARASKRLSSVSDDELLEHAPIGKTLAEMASKVYPEAQIVDQSTHLAFFSVAMARPEDGEAQAIDLVEHAPTDPLDDY